MSVEAILKYPAIFLTALLVSLMLTPLWIRLAPRIGMVDHPGGRKSHSKALPVGGGVAVFLAFHAACAALFLLPWQPFAGQLERAWWLRFAVLSAGVVGLGLWDDRQGLRPGMKLAGQTAIALGAYALGIRIQNVLGLALPEWVNLAGTVFWFLALMNAFNLIDGIDGLAAGIGLIAALGIGLSLVFRKLPGDALLMLGLGGACLGFLRYNFYPARVFLGDTGSLFIGFTLAALAISTSSKGSTMAVVGMPLLAAGVPLFDTLLAIWRRSVRRFAGAAGDNGGGVGQGDVEHLHHRLLRGRDPRKVAWLLYAMTAALVLTGILASVFRDRAIGILGIGFVIATYTVFRHLAWIELRDSGQAVLRGIAQPVRRNRMLLFYLVFDVLSLNLAWVASMVLMAWCDMGADTSLRAMWMRSVPIDVVIPFTVLVLSRAYTRLWYLARVGEYVMVGLALLFGGALACSVNLLQANAGMVPAVVLHHVLMTSFALPAIVGVRAALRLVQDLMQWIGGGTGGGNACHERALVWGAGYRTTLFLRQCAFRGGGARAMDVIGIVSDDDALRGHYVHGVRVLGNTQDLPYLVKARRIDRLYLVEPIPDEGGAIRRLLHGSGVTIVQWKIVEAQLDA